MLVGQEAGKVVNDEARALRLLLRMHHMRTAIHLHTSPLECVTGSCDWEHDTSSRPTTRNLFNTTVMKLVLRDLLSSGREIVK